MRRFMVALGLFWLALPALASVGLGEIEVRSFLNQPLDAEIRVDGASVGDPTLAIRVAPEEDYRRVGLTRGSVPPDLVITIDGAGASRVVRLSTQRPVREPYIGLLLEASWSGGRTLREYTLLLDPPVAFAPTRSAPPELSAAPPAAAVQAAPPVAGIAPVDRPRPGVYRVNRGDTLFGIVRGMGYAGVTDQQVMLAILDANPDGFIGQNINQMRADVTLTLPSEADAAQRSPVLAQQEVQRQAETWRARVAPAQGPPPAVALAPPDVPTVPPLPEERRPEPPAELATPSEEPPAATAPVVEVEPEVVIDEGTTGSEGIDDPVTGVSEEPVVAENMEGTGGVAEDRLEILAERASDLEVTPTQASTLILEEALLSQQAAMDALRDELVSLRSELSERDQLLSVVSTELAQLEERMQALRGQAPAAGAASLSDQPLHERILADPLLLIVVGTLLLLVLLLLLALFRRPRQREIITAQPADAGSMGIMNPAAEDIENAERSKIRSGVLAGATAGAAMASPSVGGGSEPAERASGAYGDPEASEDEISESMAEGRMGEEDVLADVELYLAYGMNDQAIGALEHAINQGHDSLLYRVRLLEAHGANDDADTVRQQAEVLRAELGPEDGEWLTRIVAVESLFSQPSDAVTAEGPKGPTAYAPSETGPVTTPVPAGSSPASPIDPGAIEFDTSDFDRLGATPTEETRGPESVPAADAKSGENLMQFNLDELESLPGAGETPPDTPAKEAGESPADLPPLVFTDKGESATGSEAGDAGPVSSSTDMDSSEVGMKLNLAEAFAEMGDREGALALLDEIGSTGTEEQLAKVAEIRSKLDRE
ncbi:MAG TPA: FimV/HubP family polar landmark protein [Thioalkalivibrio sp.]|nr:FimV/HubP family polar landmark protein [Thioalkalivibrio sp.]